MMKKQLGRVFMVVVLFLVWTVSCFAMGQLKNKKAIVLAAFGTTYPSALVSITNIQKRCRRHFQGWQ